LAYQVTGADLDVILPWLDLGLLYFLDFLMPYQRTQAFKSILQQLQSFIDVRFHYFPHQFTLLDKASSED